MLATGLAARRPRFHLQLRAFRFEGLASPAIRGGQPRRGTLTSRRGSLCNNCCFATAASELDLVSHVDRHLQGPAILASTQSASIPRVTSVPARLRSCDGTLMLGHGDSAMDSASHATYERPHHGGIRFQRLIAEFRFRLFQRPRLAPGNVRSRICFGFFAPDIWRPDTGATMPASSRRCCGSTAPGISQCGVLPERMPRFPRLVVAVGFR